jgi:asparagine synthase (glutamine-hydrolysing)
MCGIVGIVAHSARVLADVLERATQSLAHRGPDDSGTVIFSDSQNPAVEVGLGNRRLAILDLSALGHQPMNDPETGNWIVHNGEIYNFRDVRARLEQYGVRFSGNSDTEVILKAYAYWRENCLREFRGMFAFAIWDAHRHRLFAARDPMGIKPFYYCKSDRHLIFASEVRALLGTGLVPPALDPVGLVNYLEFGSLYDPATLVWGIDSLPAGSYLVWQDGIARQEKYWNFAGMSEPGDKSIPNHLRRRAELESEMAQLLDESVCMQLVSDVPVGVFLSGGIDSSALVAILSRNRIRPSTFSIVFKEQNYSEAEYSRAVARHFRTDHHEIMVSQPDFLASIDAAIGAMDLPTIDGINTYFVSQQARGAGVKVALSGLGGDEMFAGYSTFRTVPRMERFANLCKHVPNLGRGLAAGAYAAIAPLNDQNRKLAALLHDPKAIIHPYFLSRMLFTPAQQRALLRADKLDSVFDQAEKPLLESLKRSSDLDPINRISYLESRCYMLNTLLRDADAMSMAHGLEVRVPLIDHQLARQVLSLPGTLKLDKAIPKPLLVGALWGQLPQEIVHRPKRGFALPLEDWMRDAMRPAVEQAICKIGEGALGTTISSPAALKVWDDFLAGRTSWSRPWSLYVLQRWCERHSLRC